MEDRRNNMFRGRGDRGEVVPRVRRKISCLIKKEAVVQFLLSEIKNDRGCFKSASFGVVYYAATVAGTDLGVWTWVLLNLKPALAPPHPPPHDACPSPGPPVWEPKKHANAYFISGGKSPLHCASRCKRRRRQGLSSLQQGPGQDVRPPVGGKRPPGWVLPACPTSRRQTLQRSRETSAVLRNLL